MLPSPLPSLSPRLWIRSLPRALPALLSSRWLLGSVVLLGALSAGAEQALAYTLEATPSNIYESQGDCAAFSITARVESGDSTPTTITLTASGPGTLSNGTLSISISSGDTSGNTSLTYCGYQDETDHGIRTLRFSGSSSAGGSVSSVNITVHDDDAPPKVTLKLTPASISENGGMSTVTATLGATSSQSTTITVAATPVSPAVTGDFTLSANKVLTIAAQATSSTGTVTITAANNDVDTANKSVTVSATATNTEGVGDPDNQTLTITDDDEKGVTVSKSSVTVTEAAGAGRTETYTVVLDSKPTGTVTVGVASGATSVATVNKSSLSFTTSTWSTAQTVTVTGVDDDVDSDRSTTITHTVSGADYAGVTAASVSVTLTDDDEKGVTVSKSSVTVTEAAGAARTETYTVVLDSKPTGTVTVGVASGATSVATVNKSSLSFTTSTWSTAQTVTVTGVDDDVDSDRSTTITHTVSGADYAGVTAASVSVTLTDDDEKGVTVSKSSVTVTEAAGAGRTETYTVVLDSKPTGTVTVGVASGATSVATVNKSSLSFTTSTWSTAQTVTVTGVDDDVDSDRSTTITHTVSGADYAGVTAASVSVTLTDDDEKGVTVSKSSVTVTEAAGAARTETYTVVLDSKPTGTVTVGVASGATSVATVNKSSLSFTTSTWSTAQTVTVTGVDDDVDSDRSTTITHTVSGADYAGVTADSVSVTLTDDDEKGVTVSKSSLALAESGGTGTYTVVLDSKPTGTVTVGVASGATSVATVNKSSLSFTTSTWSTAQTVTVTGVDDDVDSDRSTTITHTVSGADYAGVTAASVSVTLTDDDEKGVTVSKSSVTVTEAAGAARTETYTVVLDSKPTGTVTVGVASGATSVATVNKSSLSFTTSTWSTAQTVTVTGVDDDVDSDRSTTITHTVSGADYAGVTADSVSVTLTDDDEKGVTVSKSSLALAESGGTGTYTVVLDSKPTGTVTVGVASGATSVATVNKSSLSFTTSTWSTAQTVTVTGVDDDVDSDRSTTITHTVSGADYASETADSVSVTLTDDDEKGVTISKSSLALAESGGAGTYTVVLDSKPTGTVTVGVSSGDTSVATVDKSSLEFTTATWSAAQTVTVAGAGTGGTSTSVTHSVSGADYSTVTAASVAVTLVDVVINLSVSDNDVSEGDGDTEVTVTARLQGSRTFPSTKTVTITVEGSGTPAAVGFQPVNPFTLQIPADQQSGSKAFTLRPVPNNVDNPDETLTVSGAAETFAANSATIALRDDDDAPTGIRLFASPDSLSEGDNATEVTVTAQLQGGTTLPADLALPLTLAGSAIRGPDYTLTGKETVTIPATQASGQTVLTITPTHDSIDEGASETIEIGTSAAGYQSTSPAEVTLADDDRAGLTLGKTHVTVTEAPGAGRTNRYTVVLDSKPTGTVTVGVASGDPSVATVDKSSLSFTTTTWSRPQTVTVTGVDDRVDSDRRTTITHRLSGADYTDVTPARVRVTLTDDDTAGVKVDPEELQVTENGHAFYTLELTSEPLSPVVISISRLGDNVENLDWDPRRLTFSAADWNRPQRVAVSVRQDPDVLSGVALMRHTASSPDPAYSGIGIDDVEIVVGDDDQVVTSAVLTLSDEEIAEGEPSALVTVTATLDAVTATDLSIALSLGGTATEQDYSVGGVQPITIDAGKNTGQTVLTFVPNDDALVEGEETIIVNGASPGLTVSQATLTLVDDDTAAGAAVGSLSVDIDRVAESARDTLVTVILTLEDGFTFDELRTFEVAVRGTGNDAAVDFAPVEPLTLTLLSNISTASSTFVLRPENDLVDETDETLTIAAVASPVPITSTTIALVDDDAPPTSISLSVDDPDIAEGEPATDITLTATVDGGTTFARPLTVTLAFGGTATEGREGDYTVSGPASIPIPPGARAATATLMFTPIDDSRDELDEIIEIAGTTPTGLPVNPTSLTVLDNDESLLTLRAEPRRLEEGAGPATVTLTVTVRSGTPYDESLAVALEFAGTAIRATDYTVAGALTFTLPAGQVSASTTLALTPIDDSLDEPDETIEIIGNAGLGRTGPAVILLEDNDIPPARIFLSVAPDTLQEADPSNTGVTLTATVDGNTAFSSDTEVLLDLAGTAVPAVDYDVGGLAAPLVIPAGRLTASREITIAPLDDTLPEGVEHILISGTSVVRVVQAEISLIDDDGEDLTVSFSRADYAANEYGAPARVVVTVTPAADRREAISLSVVLAGGAGPDDYAGVPDEVVFRPGDDSFTFSVEALPDDHYESGESIRLRLATLSAKVALDPIPSSTVRLIEQRPLQDFSGELQTVLALSARAWSGSVQSTLEERFSRARQTEEWVGWQTAPREPSPPVSPLPATTRLKSPSSLADRVIPGDWLASWRQRNERRNMGMIRPRLSLGKLLAKIRGWRPVLWAEGNTHHFSGNLRTLDYQGGFQAAHVGLDLHSGKKTLLGASLMRGQSLIDYSDGAALDGETRATLYSVHPYLHVRATDRIALWALGGFAAGPVAVRELDRDHELRSIGRLAGGGARFLAKSWKGRELAVRTDADAAWVGADLEEASAAIGGLAGRVRLLAEMVQTLRLFGQTLMATGEAGGRVDRGAAHRGAALEAAGRISWRKPEVGLDISAHGRSLLRHQSSFRMWGAGLQAGWDPGAEKRGLVVRFASGRGPRGGKTRLFHESIDRLHHGGDGLDTELELGYGTGLGARVLTLTFRLQGLSGWTAAVDLR